MFKDFFILYIFIAIIYTSSPNTHQDKTLAWVSGAIKILCQKQSHEKATKGRHYFTAKILEKGNKTKPLHIIGPYQELLPIDKRNHRKIHQ